MWRIGKQRMADAGFHRLQVVGNIGCDIHLLVQFDVRVLLSRKPPPNPASIAENGPAGTRRQHLQRHRPELRIADLVQPR